MRDLGKLIVAKGFKKLPKVQKIAKSGHTDGGQLLPMDLFNCLPSVGLACLWTVLPDLGEIVSYKVYGKMLRVY